MKLVSRLVFESESVLQLQGVYWSDMAYRSGKVYTLIAVLELATMLHHTQIRVSLP